ncbi:MAG: hypothetical protein NTY80_01480 [candidate division SR1 bacterium]|nr:hypothetical protein [candidate division SR1 bacterium]
MDRKRIFNVAELAHEAELQAMREFIAKHKFCVIELDETTMANPILRAMAMRSFDHYKHVAVIVPPQGGCAAFNAVIDGSSSHIDKRMLPHKEIPNVFHPKVHSFFSSLKEEGLDFQIRGMHTIVYKI